MTAIQTWRASRTRAADGQALTTGSGHNRSDRARAQLWALLNAQALLSGAAGTPGGTAPIEDDRRRMAVRRAD